MSAPPEQQPSATLTGYVYEVAGSLYEYGNTLVAGEIAATEDIQGKHK